MADVALELTGPDGSVRTITLGAGELIVGRDPTCGLPLSGAGVSRRHARLWVAGGEVRVQDLGSTNGTYVNGARISGATAIPVGGEVRVGSFRLERPRPASGDPEADPVDAEAAAREKVHRLLLERMNLRSLDREGAAEEVVRDEVRRAAEGIVAELRDELPASLAPASLVQGVLDEALGLGPLEGLLADADTSEVMVNRKDQIYVERKGKLVLSDLRFSSDRAVLNVIERIVSPLGRRIDESSPMVDARLKDGSRVNAIIPPLALKGPCLTIRKFSRRRLGLDDLVSFGSMTPAMGSFFRLAVEHRQNVVISGGTGSGKTTLLNVLSSLIPPDERIVTVEDAAELQLLQEHVVSLESRPPNVEGKGAVTIRDLVRNCLRMRPDRIVVGECRGGEALDMLQAMNTGHDGSLTTAHANTPRDMLRRLETMVLMSGMDLPVRAIREQIAGAVNLIIQQSRLPDGARKITHVVEVQGMEGEQIVLQEIFRFDRRGYAPSGKVEGSFVFTGFMPRFVEELRRRGVALPADLFPGGGS